MGEQERNVVRAFAERRQAQRDDGEAIIEVFAELAFLDHLPEVAVRRADETQVQRDRAMRAEPLDRAGLEETEDFHLRGGVDLPDLIEEEGAAVRGFETSDAAFVRPGEGALLMAERAPTRGGWPGWRRNAPP
jgi:hypothetical protein